MNADITISFRVSILLALFLGPAEYFNTTLQAQVVRPTLHKVIRFVGSSSSTVNILAPTAPTSYSMILPTTTPVTNQVLSVGTVTAGVATLNWSVPVGGIGSGTSGQVVYWNGNNGQTGSNELFWDAINKRLGIGTNTPTEKFQINEPGNSSVFSSLIARGGNNLKAQLTFGVKNNAGTAVGGYLFSDGTIGGGLTLQGNLNDQPSTTPHVFVNPMGKLLVNSTTDVGAYKLQVNGDIYAPTARFYAVNSGGYDSDLNLRADGTLTKASSDYRLKKNIETISNPLQKVMAMRGVTYNWKDSTIPKRMMGMIAQEVLSVAPELVFQNQSDGYYGINYGETSGLLIEAIKAQQQLIQEIRGDLQRQQQKLQSANAEIIQLKKQLTSSKTNSNK